MIVVHAGHGIVLSGSDTLVFKECALIFHI